MKTCLFYLAVFIVVFVPAHAVTTIYGSGQSDLGWRVSEIGDTQIALRAKNSATDAMLVANGSFVFTAGQAWNYDISFNSNLDVLGVSNLMRFTYEVTITGPGPMAYSFDPRLINDNSYGNNSTPNGAGVEGFYMVLSGGNNIMQLSQGITNTPHFNSLNLPGTYQILATISENDQLVNIFSTNVLILENKGSVPDGGYTLWFTLLGIGFLVIMKKRGVTLV